MTSSQPVTLCDVVNGPIWQPGHTLNVSVCDFKNSVFVRSLNLSHIIINCSDGSFVACIKGYKSLLRALPPNVHTGTQIQGHKG